MFSTSGKFAPTAKDSTMNTMPSAASFQPEKLYFFWIRPNTTANTMNMMDTMPAAPLVWAAAERLVTPSFTA